MTVSSDPFGRLRAAAARLGSLRAVITRPGFIAIAVLAVLGAAALAAGVAVGTWRSVCHACPSIAQIYTWEPIQSTKILSHDGEVIAELFQERRTPVSVANLPPHVPQAFIAVEDKRFYEHRGFDFRGLSRAVTNLFLGRRGGGSTITQQLARNMFSEQVGFERQLTRKLKEARVARELENVYTKDQILEAYLNQVNYGHGWWGIETAAQRYFGKPAAEMNPAEAAMLAAVINLPTHLSPFRNPERALNRRNLVLSLMAEQGHLGRAEVEHWKQEPLPEEPHGVEDGDLAPYFVEWVRMQLDDRYGSDLYRRGYRVFTSLDVEMQRAAATALEAGLRRIEGEPGYRNRKYEDVAAAGGSTGDGETPYLQGAFIAYDVRTGEVRALVGGRDFRDSKFNRAVQARRQPGSAFKPFVFAAALASGIPSSHVIFDSPIMIPQADGTTWSPRNYDGDFKGPMTLRDAMKRSINTVAVKLGQEVGIETVAQYARRMGIQTPIPRVPSTAIGAADVLPIQMVEAYSPLATGGYRVRPRPIVRIEDADGRVLWESRVEREPVLDPLVAFLAGHMLRDVVDRGTGYSIRNPEIGNVPYTLPAGGKTGTTNDATDVWFVGFTPDLVAGVWMGFDRPRQIITGAAGGRYAAPVWAGFMREVYFRELPMLPVPEEWPHPPELTTRRVDLENGKLATEWCPLDATYMELYIPGTEPGELCDLHGPGIFGAPLRRTAPDTLADTLSDSIPIRIPNR